MSPFHQIWGSDRPIYVVRIHDAAERNLLPARTRFDLVDPSAFPDKFYGPDKRTCRSREVKYDGT